MQPRKLGLGVVFACLALLLTSCIEVKGEMSINSAARLNGEITYTIDKSLASASGISTLSELNKQATQQSESDLGFCKDVPFTEDASNYIFKCPLKDANICEKVFIALSVSADMASRLNRNTNNPYNCSSSAFR